MSDAPIKLLNKLNLIMGELEDLSKKGAVAFGNTKYKYLMAADAVDALKPLFIKHKVRPDIDELPPTFEGDKVVTHSTIELTDIESGQSKLYHVYGIGQDKGDKAIYKAYTGGLKYFYKRNFMISEAGDDPESVQDDPEITATVNDAMKGFIRKK